MCATKVGLSHHQVNAETMEFFPAVPEDSGFVGLDIGPNGGDDLAIESKVEQYGTTDLEVLFVGDYPLQANQNFITYVRY